MKMHSVVWRDTGRACRNGSRSRIRIAASISVTRCERGPRVRVIGWASGRLRSVMVRAGMEDCNCGEAGALSRKGAGRQTIDLVGGQMPRRRPRGSRHVPGRLPGRPPPASNVDGLCGGPASPPVGFLVGFAGHAGCYPTRYSRSRDLPLVCR
jgi:hypothetical protein